VRSFFNLLVVLVVYFAGISANTGDKQTRKASQSDVGKIVLKDGRIVYKEAKFAQPLKAGKIPDVTVKDIDGKGLKLREMAAGRPMLLVFYRGGWCPFCNRQLAGLQEIKDQIADKGYQLVAVSADRPEKIRQSLKDRKLTYGLYSDSTMAASIAFGLAFRVPDNLVKTYKDKYSIDIEDASGEKHHYLPVPAVYVVSSDGKIQFAHAEADYKVRLSNEEVLASLK
jgi:peroxiredoxin